MGKRIESPHFLVQTGRPKITATPLSSDVPPASKFTKQKIGKLKPLYDEKPRRQKPLPRPTKPIPRKSKKKRILTNGKVVRGHKYRPIVDDEKYCIDLRNEPCAFTGLRGTEDDPVEAMHIGNPGKSIKSDNEALPARHSFHARTHTKEGLVEAVIECFRRDPDFLIAVLRSFAREVYAIKKAEQEPQDLTGGAS